MSRSPASAAEGGAAATIGRCANLPNGGERRYAEKYNLSSGGVLNPLNGFELLSHSPLLPLNSLHNKGGKQSKGDEKEEGWGADKREGNTPKEAFRNERAAQEGL